MLHQVIDVLEAKGQLELTTGRISQYQAILPDIPEITPKPCQTPKPATLLPESKEHLVHKCIENARYGVR